MGSRRLQYCTRRHRQDTRQREGRSNDASIAIGGDGAFDAVSTCDAATINLVGSFGRDGKCNAATKISQGGAFGNDVGGTGNTAINNQPRRTSAGDGLGVGGTSERGASVGGIFLL